MAEHEDVIIFTLVEVDLFGGFLKSALVQLDFLHHWRPILLQFFLNSFVFLFHLDSVFVVFHRYVQIGFDNILHFVASFQIFQGVLFEIQHVFRELVFIVELLFIYGVSLLALLDFFLGCVDIFEFQGGVVGFLNDLGINLVHFGSLVLINHVPEGHFVVRINLVSTLVAALLLISDSSVFQHLLVVISLAEELVIGILSSGHILLLCGSLKEFLAVGAPLDVRGAIILHIKFVDQRLFGSSRLPSTGISQVFIHILKNLRLELSENHVILGFIRI